MTSLRLRVVAALARQMALELPCRIDPIYEILAPEHEHDPREAFREKSADATALEESCVADPSTAIAERLVCYLAMAAATGHQWPMFADHVAQHLADEVSESIA